MDGATVSDNKIETGFTTSWPLGHRREKAEPESCPLGEGEGGHKPTFKRIEGRTGPDFEKL